MKLISLTNKKGDPWCTTYRFFKCIFQPIPCYALHYSFVQAWKILLFTVYFILSVKKNWWDFESPFVHLESHLAFILIFDSSSKNAPRLWFTAINFKRTVFFFFFFFFWKLFLGITEMYFLVHLDSCGLREEILPWFSVAYLAYR